MYQIIIMKKRNMKMKMKKGKSMKMEIILKKIKVKKLIKKNYILIINIKDIILI